MIVTTIFRREWTRHWHSRALRILLPLNLFLVIVVASVHWFQQQAFLDTQHQWQHANDELWQKQPDRHPHRVAHYGSLAFRYNSPLSFLDAGVTPFVGNVLLLEAHRQNSSGLRQFSVSARELGLGYLSVSTLVLILWPLVLIALAHGAVSDERSNGNLNLLHSLGMRPWQLMLGHGLVFTLISILYLACLGLLAALCVSLSPMAADTDTWLRLGACLLLYLLYCLSWIAAILVVSCYARSSDQSLLLALCLWLLWVIVIPKTLTTLVETQYPTPSRAMFEVSLEKAIAQVGDSHDPNDAYFTNFRDQILQKYQVTHVEDLPINWRGVVMQEGERIGKMIFDNHYQQLIKNYAQQDTLYSWLGLVSPYAIASRYSMAITGSSANDHYEFERQAEAFRFQMITRLNALQAEQVTYAADKKTRLSRNFWAEFEHFDYRPTPAHIGSTLTIAGIICTLLWSVLMLLGYQRATRQG